MWTGSGSGGWEGDLYSSGPTPYVTMWRERRSERIRLCVQDIYLEVRVQVCTSQGLFVCAWRGSLLHTRVN